MRRSKRLLNDPAQTELFGIIWRPFQFPFRLRVGDVIPIDDRLGLIVRVTESAAVVLINQQRRDFTTRFDKPVRFQPKPKRVYISAESEVPILNRKARR